MGGVLTSIVVIDHNEPYGYFSIDPPEFAVQFVRKSIRDRFRVGDDIDAISTATLTVTSTSRAVRNGRAPDRPSVSEPGGREVTSTTFRVLGTLVISLLLAGTVIGALPETRESPLGAMGLG